MDYYKVSTAGHSLFIRAADSAAALKQARVQGAGKPGDPAIVSVATTAEYQRIFSGI